VGSYCVVSANGAVSCQPETSPQESSCGVNQALKARFNFVAWLVTIEGKDGRTESRLQRWYSLGAMNPGALPRAACECAPLALNTYKSSASRYNRINVLLQLVIRKHYVCDLAWIIARQVGVLRRMRFPLFDDRRNHRTIFDP